MSYTQRHRVTVTTAADGTATGYTPALTGRLVNIIYTKADTDPFADGVDFTIEAETSGLNLWTELNVNASKTVVPTQPTHSQAGVAATYDGTRAALGPVYLAQDRVKIAIAQGGDSKAGTFDVIVVGPTG